MRWVSAPLGCVPLTFAPSTTMQSSPASGTTAAAEHITHSAAMNTARNTARAMRHARISFGDMGRGLPVLSERCTRIKRTMHAAPITAHSHKSDCPKRTASPMPI